MNLINKYSGLLLGLLVVAVALFFTFFPKKTEGFGSDWAHHFKLREADIYNKITKKLYGAEEERENFEPSKYVLNDYSDHELKPPTEFVNKAPVVDMGEDQEKLFAEMKGMEESAFLQPVTYYDESSRFSKLEQVEANDAGSGNLKSTLTAYEEADEDQFYKNIKMVSSRGGNR